MPSVSTLDANQKSKVKAAIPTSANKIFTATLGRIYYAYPDPNAWSYTGLQGAIVFTRDNTRNTFILKMVDVDGTRGVTWEHEVYQGMEFHMDRPFFHSFGGDVSL